MAVVSQIVTPSYNRVVVVSVAPVGSFSLLVLELTILRRSLSMAMRQTALLILLPL